MHITGSRSNGYLATVFKQLFPVAALDACATAAHYSVTMDGEAYSTPYNVHYAVGKVISTFKWDSKCKHI